MLYKLLTILFIFFYSNAYAAFPPVNWIENDDNPSVYPTKVRFPNGSLSASSTGLVVSFVGVTGTSSHPSLTGLDYSSSGHTGFQDTVTEGSLTDSVITSADIKNGEIVDADTADGVWDFGTSVEANTLTEGGVAVLNNDEIDASSELAAIMDDETGTAGNLVFSTSPTITTPTISSIIDYTMPHSFSITNATATADRALFRVPYNTTLTSVGCIITAGTNTTGAITECDSDGRAASCIESHTVLNCTTTYNSTASFGDAAFDTGDWLGWNTTAATGAVNLTVTWSDKRTN